MTPSHVLAASVLALLLLAPMTAAGDDPLTDLLYAEPAPYDEVAVPWDLSGPAAYVELHAWVNDPGTGWPTAVFALEDPEGALIMYLMVDSGQLKATDGYEDDGVTPRPLVTLPAVGLDELWHRYDVRIEGGTYRLQVDQMSTVTLRTFTSAMEVQLADTTKLPHGPGEHQEPVEIGMLRFLPPEAIGWTFSKPLAEDGWSATALDGGTVATQPSAQGHEGAGQVRVHGAGHPLRMATYADPVPYPGPSLAYAHHSIPEYEGGFVAGVSSRPFDVSATKPGGVPDHQAVLAGVSGPSDGPVVHWAIVQAQSDVRYDEWTLYLIGPDDTRTPLSSPLNALDPHWHEVRVLVDEAEGTLVIGLDGSGSAARFQFDALGTSERIGIGDVWLDHPHWSGGGTGFYDNVVLMPWEAGT